MVPQHESADACQSCPLIGLDAIANVTGSPFGAPSPLLGDLNCFWTRFEVRPPASAQSGALASGDPRAHSVEPHRDHAQQRGRGANVVDFQVGDLDPAYGGGLSGLTTIVGQERRIGDVQGGGDRLLPTREAVDQRSLRTSMPCSWTRVATRLIDRVALTRPTKMSSTR